LLDSLLQEIYIKCIDAQYNTNLQCQAMDGILY